jgi:hypothetical protein
VIPKVVFFVTGAVIIFLPIIWAFPLIAFKRYYEKKEGIHSDGPTALCYPSEISFLGEDIAVFLTSFRGIVLTLSGVTYCVFLYLILFSKTE